jgi:SAM-dependent methyltransferase
VTAFQDHFSAVAVAYARARPTYPPALYAELAALSPGHALAWDCGTGNGQAALGLAAHFDAVLATDPSAAQVAQTPPHPRLTVRLAPEAASGLPAGTADLVTAAQAAHWFDLDAFYAEVRRVLRPHGVLALWCYGLCRVAPAVDKLLDRFSRVTVGRYWPPGRRHVDAAYRSLAFPFPEAPFPPLVMERRWRLEELGAYVRTWSAVTQFSRERGFDPVAPLLRELAPVWGAPEEARAVTWALAGRVGRLPTDRRRASPKREA